MCGARWLNALRRPPDNSQFVFQRARSERMGLGPPVGAVAGPVLSDSPLLDSGDSCCLANPGPDSRPSHRRARSDLYVWHRSQLPGWESLNQLLVELAQYPDRKRPREHRFPQELHCRPEVHSSPGQGGSDFPKQILRSGQPSCCSGAPERHVRDRPDTTPTTATAAAAPVALTDANNPAAAPAGLDL